MVKSALIATLETPSDGCALLRFVGCLQPPACTRRNDRSEPVVGWVSAGSKLATRSAG